MELPKNYEWLANEAGPKMLIEALKLLGVVEGVNEANNPVILGWAKEVGGEIAAYYKADATPWCGLFMSIIAKRSGKDLVKAPLRALSWVAFGDLVKEPMLGDVMVFALTKGSHVGLYVGEDAKSYHILGGNQSDKVCITRFDKKSLYAAQRPKYTVAPTNIRKIMLANTGAVVAVNTR